MMSKTRRARHPPRREVCVMIDVTSEDIRDAHDNHCPVVLAASRVIDCEQIYVVSPGPDRSLRMLYVLNLWTADGESHEAYLPAAAQLWIERFDHKIPVNPIKLKVVLGSGRLPLAYNPKTGRNSLI